MTSSVRATGQFKSYLDSIFGIFPPGERKKQRVRIIHRRAAEAAEKITM
jgi:hypothetical protein